MDASDFYFRLRPDSPATGYVQPTLSDDPADNLAEPYRALEVWATGVVAFVSIDGQDAITPTISGSMLPYTINCAILRVKGTGTTVTAADLRGLK